MKSVLRSAFDPVPRPLSQVSQLLLVGILVVGIVISVVEYVESSGRPASAADSARLAAKESVTPNLQPAAETVVRPRSLVRLAPRPENSVRSAAEHPTPAAPAATGAAPMSLEPGEGG